MTNDDLTENKRRVFWPAEGFCMHCRKFGLEKIGGKSQLRSARPWYDHYLKYTVGVVFGLYYCDNCSNVTLIRTSYITPEWDVTKTPDDPSGRPEVLYPPVPHIPLGLPEPVELAYKDLCEALSDKPESVAVEVRKLLEIVCDERQASGTTLAKKLSFLATSGVMPPVVFNICSLLRRFGNSGAHRNDALAFNDAWLVYEASRMVLQSLYGLGTMEKQLQTRADELGI